MRRAPMGHLLKSAVAAVLAVPAFVVVAGDAGAVTGTCGGKAATITGTDGEDTLVGTLGRDVILALAGADTITGLAEHDVICGGAGVDHVDAGAGDDTVWGGPDGASFPLEADWIEGGPGDDELHGGNDPAEIGGVQRHEDIVVYDSAPGGVRVDLDEPTVTGQGTDTIDGFFSVIGSQHNDVITASAETDVVRGLGGADTLTIDSDEGEVFGGGGNDVMRLGVFVYAGTGDDTITNARAEAWGGPGNDLLIGRPSGDELNGGDGNDVLRGRGGPDRVTGGGGRNRIFGGTGADDMVGGYDEDRMLGGPGDDVLNPGDSGGPGSLRYSADDDVDGGSGSDWVSYGTRADVRVDLAADIATGAGRDRLERVENASGGYGDDELLGSNGPNVLSGGPGGDVLEGHGGRDTLQPADDHGHDTLRGGLGSDLVNYSVGDGSGPVDVDLAAGTVSGYGADTVASVERLQGTLWSDDLFGNVSDNVLRGMGGDDVLVGRGGSDRAGGGAGQDSCDAEQMSNCEP